MGLDSDSLLSGSNLMTLYFALSFIIIVGVREWVSSTNFRGVRN